MEVVVVVRTRSIEQQEEEVRAYAKQRPVTLVLPSLYSELQGKALEHIVQILGELDYLDDGTITAALKARKAV